MIAKTILKITPMDLSVLRMLKTDDGERILRNYRDPQDLGHRTVFDLVNDGTGWFHIVHKMCIYIICRHDIIYLFQRVTVFLPPLLQQQPLPQPQLPPPPRIFLPFIQFPKNTH